MLQAASGAPAFPGVAGEVRAAGLARLCTNPTSFELLHAPPPERGGRSMNNGREATLAAADGVVMTLMT